MAAADSTVHEAVLTWLFFLLLLPLGLGLVGQQLGLGTAAGEGVAGVGLGLDGTVAGVGLGTAAGVGLGLNSTAAGDDLGLDGEPRGLPVVQVGCG